VQITVHKRELNPSLEVVIKMDLACYKNNSDLIFN